MIKYAEKTLAQIVTDFPLSASVLEKHHLDFCCKGKQTLKSACLSSGQLDEVEEELSSLFSSSNPDVNPAVFREMETNVLINHILNKHHEYVRDASPRILEHLKKVADKHGSRHPELLEVLSIFSNVNDELVAHMIKEEQILFPAIRELHEGAGSGKIKLDPVQLSAPIQVMEMEHESVGGLLAEIKNLTNKYSPPSDACMTYRLSYDELKGFEEDLHQHVHLENNILFPRFIVQSNHD